MSQQYLKSTIFSNLSYFTKQFYELLTTKKMHYLIHDFLYFYEISTIF